MGGLCLPADSSGWANVCSHWLIQKRHLLILLFFSDVNCSEGEWSGSTEVSRVGGVPWSRELVVNFAEERRGSLARGLTATQQEPLVQTAARGLFWWRPLQSQLFNQFWEDTEKFGIHPAALGADEGRRAASVTESDSSSASEAANDMLSSAISSSFPPNETKSLALAELCWSVCNT